MSQVRKFGGTIYVRATKAASSQAPAVGMGGVFSCRPPRKWAVGWLLLVVTFVLGCPPSAPPPAVGPLTCRAKPGKVDLLWTAAANATNYDVMRAQGGAAPSIVSTVQNPVYADFGLTDGVTYTYTVVARNSLGSAAPSPTCSATPNDRGVPPPDQPPQITSTPIIEAFENTVWYYDVTAVDPEGLAVSIAPVAVPFGMNFDPATSRLSWSPSVSQIGPHAVQVSASDPAGNSVVQPFTIDVKDFDDPPTITSAPERFVMVGQTYDYPATAFDPEGQALGWTLAAAPAGMTIGAQSGALQWTPTAGDVGSTQVTVEVRDPAGNLDAQTYELDVLGVSVQLLSPSGVHTVPAGTALTLPVTANHPKALLSGGPLPSGSSLVDGTFTFTPTRDQEGRFDIQFEARLAGARDADLVTIQVTVPNGPPQITALPIQTVDEGQTLSFVVTATDPDGDEVKISAPGLGLPNAIFNELTSRLDFTPAFDQQGSYNLTFVADDGQATGQGVVQVDVIDVAPPATNLTLVVDPPQSPTFARNTPITGSVVGQAGPPPVPAPLVFITGVAPTEVRQGRSATVVLDGLNTQFVDGQVSAQFGAGVQVDDVRVLSPTQLEVDVTVAADAAVGVRQVVANDSGSQVSSVVAFSVTPGAAQLSGQVIDPFTQQPVAGAVVSVPGTNLFTTTAADGTFTLDGVLGGGAQKITISAPNFELLSVDISLGPNAVVDLDVPIDLKALARPFVPGGSLPRAARLASVLDRGASSLSVDLDIEQAEALISDTLIVVGGTEAGVLDENGVQLNPNVQGAGMMSLTPQGLTAQARALIEGHVMSLGDLTQVMIDLFDWPTGKPLAEDFIATFQQAVNEAWADPADPTNAMPILLFNPGPNLALSPPLLTQDTPVNRLQAFLILSAWILETVELIEGDIDQLLLAKGIDPTQYSAISPSGRGAAERIAGLFGTGLGWVFGQPAYAQGTTVLPPNGFRGGTNGRTFRKIFKQTHQAAQLEAAFAVAIPVAAATAAAAATAIMTGGTILGVAGAVAATGAVVAVMDGLLAILWQKYIVGMFLAAALQELSPQPPLPTSSFIEGDKFFLEFDQSTTHSVNAIAAAGGPVGVNGLGLNPQLLQYSYELFRFPDMQTTNENQAVPMGAELVPLANGRWRFVIPAAKLRVGANYFRIATVQTVKKVELTPVDSKLRLKVQQAPVSQPGPADFAKEAITKFPYALSATTINNILVDNALFYNQNFQQSLNGLAQNVRNQRVQSASQVFAANEAMHRRVAQSTAAERAVLGVIDGELDTTGQLKSLAGSANYSPDDFLPGGNGNAAVAGILPPGSPAPSAADLGEVRGMAFEAQTIRTERIAMGDYRATKRDLKAIRKQIAVASVGTPGGSSSVTYVAVDPNTKVALSHTTTVPHTPAGIAQVEGLMALEDTKVSVAKTRITSANHAIDQIADTRLNRKVPANYNQLKTELQTKITRVEGIEKLKNSHLTSHYDVAVIEEQRRSAKIAGATADTRASARRQTATNQEAIGNFGKGVNQGMNAIGVASAALDPATSFLQGVQVLESSFSAVHMFVKDPRQQFTKPPVLADPDLSRFGGVITARTDPLNPKGGQVLSIYPGAKYVPDEDRTGFPPLFLANDALGRVFSINGRSTTQFGGRLFRFNALGAMERAFAGSVKYYSVLIGYGRPASPIAMAVGEYWEAAEPAPLEDLFVANTDFIENPPRNEILRVPTHLLDRLPYSNGLGVDHVVGQTYVTDPAFQFTGPSDMAIIPANGSGTQRLLLTDEDTIWLIKQDLTAPDSAPQLSRLLVEAGRRWSGITVDVLGNVYVADYASGDLMVLSSGDVFQLENLGGTPCAHIVPGIMSSPEDIALDHEQKRLVVSDDDGVHNSISLPVFVEGLPATKAFLVTFGKQLAIPLVSQTGCPDYRVVFPQHVHIEQRAVNMRMMGTAAGGPFWKEIQINLPAFGGSAVVDAGQVLQDYIGFFN